MAQRVQDAAEGGWGGRRGKDRGRGVVKLVKT